MNPVGWKLEQVVIMSQHTNYMGKVNVRCVYIIFALYSKWMAHFGFANFAVLTFTMPEGSFITLNLDKFALY